MARFNMQLLSLIFCGLAGVEASAEGLAKDAGKMLGGVNKKNLFGSLSPDELKKKFGEGKRGKGLDANKKGMKLMGDLLKGKNAKGGHREFKNNIKDIMEDCGVENYTCWEQGVQSQGTMTKFQTTAYLAALKRKQVTEKMKDFGDSTKKPDELVEEMCSHCADEGAKKKHCISKCKREATHDLMQEEIENCMSENDNIADCMCTMSDKTLDITKKMETKNIMRPMQEGLKRSVCSMFKTCTESGGDNTVASCTTAAEQVIDDASCINEGKENFIKSCMMRDLKALEDCEDSDAGHCFQESLTSLETKGFKKRQGKHLLKAQALKSAYEAFETCNCTDDTATNDECHVFAKEAFRCITKPKDSSELDKLYAKIKQKVEDLAELVCAGGETKIQMKEALNVEYSDASACPTDVKVDDLTAKVESVGLGALKGDAECFVELGKAYTKTQYVAAGKSNDEISKAADNITEHFTAEERRLATTYDEVYADQHSEEVNAIDYDDDDEAEVPATTDTGSAGGSRVTMVPIGIAIFAMALVGHANSNA